MTYDATYHRQYRKQKRAQIKAKQAEWYRRNRERLLLVAQERRANQDVRKVQAYMAHYYQENKSRLRPYNRKVQLNRRALKLKQFIEDIDPQIVYTMHGGMCGICKQFIEGEFHVDHVTSLSKGGMHGYINVQPAHPKCNLSKGARC